MIPKGGGDGSGFTPRNNPYAGPHELKLKQILKTNFGNLSDAEKSWADGAADLASLVVTLTKQRDRMEDEYVSSGEHDPGRAAVNTYQKLIDMVNKRHTEMTDVADAVKKAREASSTAWTEYNTLPVVTEPAADNPTAGITGHSKEAIRKRTEALNDAERVNTTHANSVNAAEAKARQVLATYDSEMEQATSKMRKVAGMEQPGSVTNSTTNADISPSSGRPTSSNPGVIRQPQIESTSTATPTTHTVNTGTQTPTQEPPHLTTEPPTVHHTPNTTPVNNPDHNGLLQSAPTAPPSTGPSPTTSIGPTTSPTPTSASPVVAPTLSSAAVSRTAGTAIPGSTPARSAALGRSSSSTPARGVLGRNTMMPGQSAAGRSSATAGRPGSRGMVPGQSGTRGTSGTAGSRGSRGSGRGAMAPGTGGRGTGKDRDRQGDSVDLLWDDGQEWLGDDELSPEVLD
ncbi:hypothetical protein ncot_05895 [Nocardioides sp. JQ2195]|uniref:hypothetical protein n=1 Tax=Nocardioides sp. JQ2195 TaxID=2592334 RepID=UPI00143E8A3B|nr:hypothetical protein [Nocardioides sp. JQ2195]QIX26185.1 hypothetical protein ncot_05895 [Nocardioides sp. JQ2195]